jgi:hypothetical protein
MSLYIQVENGQTVNHPAFEDNLIQAFGSVPANWEPFDRIERPVLNVYEILVSDQPTYQKIDGRWKDVWVIRPMTSEEKVARQDAVKQEWSQIGFASWVFDEDSCSFKPPVPRPTDGKTYRWDEPTTSWILVE